MGRGGQNLCSTYLCARKWPTNCYNSCNLVAELACPLLGLLSGWRGEDPGNLPESLLWEQNKLVQRWGENPRETPWLSCCLRPSVCACVLWGASAARASPTYTILKLTSRYGSAQVYIIDIDASISQNYGSHRVDGVAEVSAVRAGDGVGSAGVACSVLPGESEVATLAYILRPPHRALRPRHVPPHWTHSQGLVVIGQVQFSKV